MTDKLPTTGYIFVDRRKSGKGKSLPNRQRLLRRIKDAIRAAKPQDIDSGGVKGQQSPSASANPIKVTKKSLHEPRFIYQHESGTHEIVLIGNKRFLKGDTFPISDSDSPGSAGSASADSEDDFIVNISRDEYLKVFFEDCELPDLRDNHAKELPSYEPKHAGYQKEGNPAQLSVSRSYKNAMPRRRALTQDARLELQALEAEIVEYNNGTHGQCKYLGSTEIFDIVVHLEIRIAELRTKISAVPLFEKLDLRFTKKEKVQVKSADAVFVMIMDISGSMDEDKKRIARKFFSLQYAFIKRQYPQTDLVFIAHTEEPQELTEEEFFSTRISGGTVVSPAYDLAHKIIKSRYDTLNTNIYLSQASDGDNESHDNDLIIPALEDSGLLAKLRHMSYAEVGMSWRAGLKSPMGYAADNSETQLWTVLSSIKNSHPGKLGMVKISEDSEVFEAFHRIYKKSEALTR